jgi:hypothetical protein
MCHSGHDCASDVAAQWLAGFVATVTASAAWRDGGVLVVTWDEGDGEAGIDPRTGARTASGGGGAVLTVVATPAGPAGRVLPGPYGHFSLPATVDDAFGLPRLGDAADPGVSTIGAFLAGAG